MENKLQAQWPKTLGYFGLIPIVVSTILIFFDSYHLIFWRNMLLTYAVVILSFLGALHWAFAMTLDNLAAKKRQTMMVWSVLPSLIAWAALFIPPKYGFLLLSCFFVFTLLMDLKLAQTATLPTWYIPLRFRLTVVMTSCLMATAFLLKPLLINA